MNRSSTRVPRSARLVVAGVTVTVLAAACGGSSSGNTASKGGKRTAAGSSTVTIGGNLCLSGPAATDGKRMQQGMALGIKAANATTLSGTGQTLALATGDSHVDPQVAVSVFKNLTSVHHAVAIQMCGSAVASAMVPLAKQGDGVLLVYSGGPVYPALENPYLVSSTPTTQLWTEAMMSALQTAHVTHPCLYVQQDPNGQGVVDTFKQEFSKYGGSIACVQYSTPTTTSHTTAIAAMKSAHADGAVIYTFGPPLTLSFMQEEKQLGFNKPVYTFATVDDPAVLSNKAATGLNVVEPYSNLQATDPFTTSYMQAYRASGGTGDPAAFTDSFANGVAMVAAAVKDVTSRGQAVTGNNLKAAFASIQSYPGVGGDISLGSQHNSEVPFALEVIQNGEKKVMNPNLSTSPS